MKNRFLTIGPVQMYDSTLKVRSEQVPYFRNQEFSELMFENERLLKKLQYADDDSKVIFLTASGTGAMEATVMNLFDENDKVLVISGGTFGQRFEKICETHKIPFDSISLRFDEELTRDHFQNRSPDEYTGILVNIDETYTGQLYDIEIIKDFKDRGNMLLVVDAISSFLCDEYNMSKNHIDATIVSSQKGLCLSPGMSFVTLSRDAIRKIDSIDTKTIYFDFKDYINNMKRGQTPFTPAVGVCYELNDILKKIDSIGVESHIAEIERRASLFRKMCNDIKDMISIPKFKLSNALTPILFKEDCASDVIQYIREKENIIVNPVGGDLGKRSARISHIGNINDEDYEKVIRCIKEKVCERYV